MSTNEHLGNDGPLSIDDCLALQIEHWAELLTADKDLLQLDPYAAKIWAGGIITRALELPRDLQHDITQRLGRMVEDFTEVAELTQKGAA